MAIPDDFAPHLEAMIAAIDTLDDDKAVVVGWIVARRIAFLRGDPEPVMPEHGYLRDVALWINSVGRTTSFQ